MVGGWGFVVWRVLPGWWLVAGVAFGVLSLTFPSATFGGLTLAFPSVTLGGLTLAFPSVTFGGLTLACS